MTSPTDLPTLPTPETFHASLLAVRDSLRDRAQGDLTLRAALDQADADLLELELELAADDLAALNS